MGVHEQCIGASDEWYTPAYVFEALGETFDLDPASSHRLTPSGQWCAAEWVSGGLTRAWPRGAFVWLNPPFGGRNGIVPWLETFFAHGCGVALVPDRTSAPWWQRFAAQAHAILFVSPKIKFIGVDGKPGASPAQGTALFAAGERAVVALQNAGTARLGVVLRP